MPDAARDRVAIPPPLECYRPFSNVLKRGISPRQFVPQLKAEHQDDVRLERCQDAPKRGVTSCPHVGRRLCRWPISNYLLYEVREDHSGPDLLPLFWGGLLAEQSTF